MNLPNKLTVSRFGLTVVFLWAMFSKFAYNDTLALFFFSFAGVTDFLDGRIARARKLITNFGILMARRSSRLWKARTCVRTRR